MASRRKSIHGEWSSRWIFILAAAGSAVGLGNIWKFPYLAGDNGGGAFVLIYLLCVAVIGVPIMMAEIMLGRRGRRSPINTMRVLAKEERRSPHWIWLGVAGVLAGFLILSYYSVIAGWTMAYVFRTASGAFTHTTPAAITTAFEQLVSDPERLIAWHTIFMVMTTVVVARGVRGGLEQAVRYLMPTLFILLLVLLGYAMNTGHFVQGLKFLFAPDFSQINSGVILSAMGQAFFSLSLGMGAIMVYGSYLPQNASIARSSFSVALADTSVAILAGLAIFPIIFANGLDPGQGPGLVFKTLPIAFGQMPGGTFFGTLFFVLLVFAAWTSAISLIEPAVAYLVENQGLSRVAASVWCGIATWILGLGTVFSFNLWSGYKLFGKYTFFSAIDDFTAKIMLPIGGLLLAVFAAWLMGRKTSRNELAMHDGAGFRLWYFLVRYITPIAVILVFLHVTGIFEWLLK